MSIKLLKFKKINEGGNAFKVDKITKEDVYLIINEIEEKLLKKLKLEGFDKDCFLLGSINSKKYDDFVNDIDIGILVDSFYIDGKLKNFDDIFNYLSELLSNLKFEFKVFKGLGLVSVAFKSEKINKLVQIDLILSSTRDWVEFIYNANFKAGESKYKNLYRNILLSAIASQFVEDIEYNEKGEVLRIKRFSLDFNRGLKRVVKSFEGKNKILKNPKTLKELTEFISNVPDEVVKILLGDKFSINDVNTFENLLKIILTSNDFKLKDKRKEIIDDFKEKILNLNMPLPEEIK